MRGVWSLWMMLVLPNLASGGPFRLHYLSIERGDAVDVPEAASEETRIFCHKGIHRALYNFWTSAVFKIHMDSNADYSIYYGDNSTEVEEMIRRAQKSWFYSRLPWKSKDVKIHPFRLSCLGVVTREQYSMHLRIYRINYWQLIMTLAGIGSFFYAPALCRNAFFHYATGVSFGVLFSLVALTYFLQKRMRASWTSWILGFYSLSLYFITSVWANIQTYLMEKHLYVLGYLLLTGLTSFAVCYRLGPVQNPRTLDLIRWAMRGFALLVVYLSSYYQSASMSLCVILLSYSSIPNSWKTSLRTAYRKRFFKPDIRLLNESEYLDQSRIETEKALHELRGFCNSPQCKPWKTMMQLSSPSRFAEFIEGGSHLTPDEIIEYSHAAYDGDDTYLGSNGGIITDDDNSSNDEIDLGGN